MIQAKKTGKGFIAAISMLLSASAFATEGAGSNFLNGVEQFAIAYAPPPGVYYTIQAADYDARELRNNNGDVVPLAFHKEIQVIAPRLTWVTKQKILGGRLVLQSLIPLMKVKGQRGSLTQTNSGLGDITLASALSYSTSPELYYAAGLVVTAPTGEYDKSNLANPGRNYWSARPRFVATRTEPDGLNADLSLSYDFNWRNNATNYKSGQEFHADYAFGWGFATDWTAGVSGFVYQQTTDDEDGSITVRNRRGRALGFGPVLKYDDGYGLLVSVAYQKEFQVKNRPAGDTISVRLVLPF